jgi:hypothetical protein
VEDLEQASGSGGGGGTLTVVGELVSVASEGSGGGTEAAPEPGADMRW